MESHLLLITYVKNFNNNNKMNLTTPLENRKDCDLAS